jgi:hypothetical protein
MIKSEYFIDRLSSCCIKINVNDCWRLIWLKTGLLGFESHRPPQRIKELQEFFP